MIKIKTLVTIQCLICSIAAMSAAPAKEDNNTTEEKIKALLAVVAFGALGGVLVQLIQGAELCRFKVKPLCTAITCPPLVGMIAFGCLARNFFGDYVKEKYPDVWADWIRQVCLSIILMRGGLSLCFDGIGTTVVLLTLTPQLCEATTAAVMSRLVFDMPWPVAFANGFTLAAVSPAVLLQSVMKLIAVQRGVKKGIPSIMLIASSFDDIVAITVFAIFVSISFSSIQEPALMGEAGNAGKKTIK